MQDGRIEDAAALMHETNPLPEICGRICPQDRLCEGDCTLETGFEAVTIGAIERWATDEALRRGWRPPVSAEATGKRVAIVGAGPAGLSVADRLARAGVFAEVFDRYAEIGGLLTYGIPPFKLDKSIVRTRRDVLEEMGVRFTLETEIGRDVAFSTLLRDYDAVFVGTGAYTSVDANLAGQNSVGVISALPFLIANAKRILGDESAQVPNLIGKRVVVLGGGDTAMDCVRTAVRMDAERVVCVYRRDEAEHARLAPRSEERARRRRRISFQSPAAGDHRRRRRRHRRARGADTPRRRPAMDARDPKSSPGSEENIAADAVITSFGFLASPPHWCDEFDIERDATGKLIVGAPGRLPLQTSHPKVFAGGDAVRGADLVVRAVYDGREAAKSILQMIGVAGVASAA